MIQYSTLSNTGGRDHNEDCITVKSDQKGFLFALADGLGGHGKGEVASAIAVNTAAGLFAERGSNEFDLKQVFLQAQSDIWEKQQSEIACRDMKTTLVVLQIEDGMASWGHIGDSRLYRFENGKVADRTLDHSVPQMLVAIGEIKEKNIRRHPDRNRLLRVLGVEEDEVRCQLAEPFACNEKQVFLLCSDGFWELIEERKMEQTLKRAVTPEQWLQSMETIVVKNGKYQEMDNYSAVAVWVDREDNTWR